jgi:hypothetical protein
MKKCICGIIFVLTLSGSELFGHSGRTDGKGGHNDRINGGYHYHHGKGPHQHPNGNCPSKGGSNNTFWYILGGIVLIGGIVLYSRSDD